MTEKSIVVENLTFRYGSLLAVDHISFEVGDGEILGFLGPNGAGKTTAVKMLTGQLSPQEGHAILLGCDIVKETQAVRSQIGVCFEQTNLYEQMSRSDAQGQLSEVKRNLRLAEYQIVQAEAGITRIQQAYENESSFYTHEEATSRIAEYRERVLKATQRKTELEASLQKITRDAHSLERTKDALAKIHLENSCNATIQEKVRVIEILDVKVYPSEKLDHIGATCAINLAGLENEEKLFSCHNTNIASPKL